MSFGFILQRERERRRSAAKSLESLLILTTKIDHSREALTASGSTVCVLLLMDAISHNATHDRNVRTTLECFW